MARHFLAVVLVLVVIGVVCADPADAANYYVDNSCSANGNGTVDGCASSTGGAGSWRDPQSCFSTARAGDTCYIKNGTYYTTNQGTDPSVTGGFHVANSGTATSRIVFRNYPGHSPLLANCPETATAYASCARPTISGDNVGYFTIQGFRIRGGIWLYGASMQVGQGERGIVIEGNDISQGWGEIDDGNWAALFLQNLTGVLIRGNYIHDIASLSGSGQQSSGSCVKLYHNTDTIVEYNTCRTVNIPESQAGGIDDKAQAVRNVHRYNWIEDVNTCVRINNQLNSTSVQIYGNICISQTRGYTSRPGIKLLTNINGVESYNNTVYGFGVGYWDSNPSVVAVRSYNNIYSHIVDNNIESYSSWTSFLVDFNSYWPGASLPRFRALGNWYNTLTQLQAGTGWDRNSLEVDCQFVSPGSDFHLRSGSPCATAGRTGGTASGSPIEMGAYGVTTCVGHTCSGGGVPPPLAPSTPTNLRITR